MSIVFSPRGTIMLGKMIKDVLNFQKEGSDAGLRLVSDPAETPEQKPVEKQFVNFIFLRVGAEWRKLDDDERSRLKADLVSLLDSFRDQCLIYSYSLVGFDSKADLMLWRIAESLDVIQDMTAAIYRTELGAFIETVDSYLSVTKRMMFVDGASEGRLRVGAGSTKYHFIYPCAKDKEWYAMPEAERDAMIEENFMVGKKFPNIKIHMTHACGFNEHDYLVSFETDEPRDFLALAEELRQTPASGYSLRGRPVYTCRQRSLAECLDALG
jgi:chlorite dismutase